MKDLQEKEGLPIEDEYFLDPDFLEISSLVQKGFENAAPSKAVLTKIHEEATRVALRKKAFWSRVRILSAAASLAILAGGVFHFVHFEAPQDSQGALFMGTPEDFLDLQSLDADSCFYGEAEIWEQMPED